MATRSKILIPRSGVDALLQFLLICGLLVAWNVVWSWYLSGQTDRSLRALSVDSLVVAGPVAAVLSTACWRHAKTVRELGIRARIDPLSGVLNRQTFVRRVKKSVATSRSGLLMLIDADFFKRVNDKYGHATGDLCIEAIGHRLSWHLRDTDLAGRIGGEEFAVFLPDVSKEHGRVVATRLGQPVSFGDTGSDRIHSITLSIGAVWISPQQSAEAQLMIADDALYQAKTTGRARLVIVGEDEPILLGRVGDETGGGSTSNVRRVTSRPRVA